MADNRIEIAAKDGSGSFAAYLARPESGGGPGIVVIQEIFGVNRVMREITDSFARQGYVAVCPDLFWRQEPGVDITDQTEAEWEKAFALYKGFDVDLGIKDIAATLAALRRLPGVSGRTGAVGYCLGGLLAYLTACRTNVDAAVGYYGVGIDGYLEEASSIAGNLMLHIAEEDGFVDKEAQARIHAALDAHPRVVIHDYPGVDHAFARPGGAHYDPAAAKLANARTAQFFRRHLGA
ncbi:MAG: dienelactone hydrolase family protein [Alphaproteobacteria bacterium]|nr:MAG: dienelactone hydrolase family protein [Alphaproteobacteria bacterium]